MTTENIIEEIAHSSLGASSAYRWMACPGSVALSKQAPKLGSSKYAAEGTVAHEICELCLKTGKDAYQYIGDVFSTEVENKTAQIEVTEDMAEAVQVYVDFVRDRKDSLDGSELKVEVGFDLGHIYEGMFGTNDACIIQPWGKLVIVDYKHGAGVAVEAENNKQLKYYGLGAGYELDYEFEEIELVIVQPRAFHKDGPIRKFTMTKDELLEFGQELKEAAEKTADPKAKLVSGDHCGWCPAAPICTYKKEKYAESIVAAFQDPTDTIVGLGDPEKFSIEDTVEAMKFAEVILGEATKWAKAVNAHALHMAEKGEELDGFKLVKGRKGNRKYNSEDEVANLFKEEYGEAIFEPKKVKSPAQLEKVIGKGKLDHLVHQPEGRYKLVPVASDSKQVKAPMSPEALFGK